MAVLADLLTPYVGQPGGLITALRAVQRELGHLPDGVEAAAADAFNLSRAEVKGVIDFYADFQRKPGPAVTVRVCAAEACQAMGGRELSAAIEKKWAAADDIGVEPVYCLGLCSVAPAVMAGDALVGRADIAKVSAALENAPEAHKADKPAGDNG